VRFVGRRERTARPGGDFAHPPSRRWAGASARRTHRPRNDKLRGTFAKCLYSVRTTCPPGRRERRELPELSEITFRGPARVVAYVALDRAYRAGRFTPCIGPWTPSCAASADVCARTAGTSYGRQHLVARKIVEKARRIGTSVWADEIIYGIWGWGLWGGASRLDCLARPTPDMRRLGSRKDETP